MCVLVASYLGTAMLTLESFASTSLHLRRLAPPPRQHTPPNRRQHRRARRCRLRRPRVHPLHRAPGQHARGRPGLGRRAGLRRLPTAVPESRSSKRDHMPRKKRCGRAGAVRTVGRLWGPLGEACARCRISSQLMHRIGSKPKNGSSVTEESFVES